MILVADSGSTKTDWIILTNMTGTSAAVNEFSTAGLNPVFHSKEDILSVLREKTEITDVREEIKEVAFFGAGCAGDEQKKMMTDVLQSFFPSAKVTVDSDLVAAALATCGNEAGVVCILGTGSNCCYYDGTKLISSLGGLGYVLGDEASGAYFGKKILAAFLYKKFPFLLHEAFEEEYSVTRSSAIENVYRKRHPNRYLASFMPFLLQHKGEPVIQQIIRDGIRDFFESHASLLEEHKNQKIHFCGSVAHGLSTFIVQACREKEFTAGKFFKRPIDGLAEYFFDKGQ